MSVQRRVRNKQTSYVVHWREDGRQRSKSFTVKRDADLWDAEVTRRKRLGTLATLDGGARTLDRFVTESWAPERAADLAARTRVFYASLYGAHIAPTFARTRLRDITAPKVAAWRAQRAKEGAGAKSLREAHSLLGGILGYACELGELQHNAARAVRPTRRPKSEPVRAWAPREVEVLRAFLAPFDAMLVGVLAYAGLRPAEALALQWRDVQDRTLLVARACDLETGGMKTTKTGGHRTVRLLAPLAGDLAAWRVRTGRPDGTAAVFAARDGQPWAKHDWDNWRRRVWQPAVVQAGLGELDRELLGVSAGYRKRYRTRYAGPRPYDLRHSFASLLLAEGRTVHYVAGQLGHGAEQTLRTYGHVIGEWEDRTGIDAEAEIRLARGKSGGSVGPELDPMAETPPASQAPNDESSARRGFREG